MLSYVMKGWWYRDKYDWFWYRLFLWYFLLVRIIVFGIWVFIGSFYLGIYVGYIIEWYRGDIWRSSCGDIKVDVKWV